MGGPYRIDNSNQRGAALLIALLILLIVSLMGLTAMKTSLFSAKIATGSQVDALSFEGAESALAASYGELSGMDGNGLQNLMDGAVLPRCLKQAGLADGSCQSSDRVGARELVQAGARIRQHGAEPVPGGQVSYSGNSMIMIDYKFEILGHSEISTFNVDDHHIQEALKRGLVSSSSLPVVDDN